MPLAFTLRLAFRCGAPVGAADNFVTARGVLSVGEARDDRSKRIVRTAEFRRTDGGEPIPALRDVELIHWGGQWVILTGIEEVLDDKLGRPRRYEQTWQMVPTPFDDLVRAERRVARLWHRLRGLGVDVRLAPDGRMFIAGGTRPEDGVALEWE